MFISLVKKKNNKQLIFENFKTKDEHSWCQLLLPPRRFLQKKKGKKKRNKYEDAQTHTESY